jgi:hypothetical protein
MKTDKSAVFISIAGTSGGTLDLAPYIGSSTERVYISGSKTLDEDFEITHSISDKGQYFDIYWFGVVTPGSYTFTIMGRVIPTLVLTHRFAGMLISTGASAPQLFIFPDFSDSGFIGGGAIGGGEIDNSHIASDAAIGVSKLEALTASRVPVLSSSGFLEASAITTAKLNFLSNVTSDIQTQLDAKLASDAASLSDANIASDAEIALSKLAPITASRVPVTNSSGLMEASSVTTTELGYISGVTSAIQTQLNNKASTTLAQGSILLGNGSNIATATDIKTSGRILVGNGTTAASVALSGDATLSAAGALTIAANAVTPAKVTAEMRTEMVVLPVSWETNYTGITTKIRIPYACSLVHIHTAIVKAVGGTDDAYITLFNNSGTAMAGGSLTAGALTIPMSSAAGTVVTSTVTGNNTFTAGQILQLKSDKATPSGSAIITLELTRA